MKYIPISSINIVNNAINFSTSDTHVIGSCDIYATKPAGDDHKLLYKVERNLEDNYAELVRLSASLSPPAATVTRQSGNRGKNTMPMRRTPEIDLRRNSPFGNLSDTSARRTFAYMIATLNAVHQDYDFSGVLRPRDFQKETNLDKVGQIIHDTLVNLRPKQELVRHLTAGAPHNTHAALVSASNEIWSERMWDMIDHEMDLSNCEVYKYKPVEDDPLDNDGALWTLHYFFFNKQMKRVCYFYVRGLSVISHSPVYHQSRWSGPTRDETAYKRANYWLNDDDRDHLEYDAAEDEPYYDPSDDEYGDIDYDLDNVRNNISAGHWNNHDEITDDIGDRMEL